MVKNGAHPAPERSCPQGPFNFDSVPRSGAPLLGPHTSTEPNNSQLLRAIPFAFSVAQSRPQL